MKQTLRTRLGYAEREYAKPALLTIGVGAVLASETVMGWQGFKTVMGDWALAVSFAISVLQVLSSHTWGHRVAHNATRQIRMNKAGTKERADSEPGHNPALPRAMSIAAGVASAFMGGMGIVPGMIAFLGNPTAGWLTGGPLSLISPLGAIGLALLMGNEAQAWRAQAAWESKEQGKADRREKTRADNALARAKEKERAQKEADRARQREEDAQRRAEDAQRRADMNVDERRAALLEEWRANPHATARTLAKRYAVDATTIRKDAQAMEALGQMWKENGEVKVVSE